MHLNSAEPNDFSYLLKINNDASPAVNKLSSDSFTKLCNDSIFLYKAVVNQNIAGFLMVLPSGLTYNSMNYKWFSRQFNNFLYIDRIVISPEYQSLGIGTALYSSLIKFGVENKWTRINCEVNTKPRNEISLKFHENLGFLPLGHQDTENGTKTVRFFTYILK